MSITFAISTAFLPLANDPTAAKKAEKRSQIQKERKSRGSRFRVNDEEVKSELALGWYNSLDQGCATFFPNSQIINLSTCSGPQNYMYTKFPIVGIKCHDLMTSIKI